MEATAQADLIPLLEEAIRKRLTRPEDLHSLHVRTARCFWLRHSSKERGFEVFLQDRFTAVDQGDVERAIEADYLDSFAGGVLERLHRHLAHPTEKFTYGQLLREEEALLKMIMASGTSPEEVQRLEEDMRKQLSETFPNSAPSGEPVLAAHHRFLVDTLATYLVWRVKTAGEAPAAAPKAPPEAGRKKKEPRNV